VAQYIVQRFLQAFLVLFCVSFVAFGVMFLTGDPTSAFVGENWTQEMVDNLRRQMGFDRPWYVQYGDFLWGAVRGDLGTSLRQHQPTFSLVMDRLPATLELALASTIISIVVAVPLGVLAAVRHGTWVDSVSMVVALMGQSMPVFWLGIMLILLFSVTFRLTPVSGRGGLDHLILPAITLAAFITARNARIVRSSMLEVLGQDYIRTARSKGLTEWRVIYGHALRNALIPIITIFGLQFGTLLGGAVITETIFAWPGVGRLTIQAIYGKDIPLVQASVMVLATIFVFINLVVDIIYTYLDPRIRLN